MTNKFGRINEAFDKLLRKKVFHRLLEWAQPSYYKQTDPEGLCLDSYLRTLSGEFDSTRFTGVPDYDRQLNFTPAPTLDHRVCRHRLNAASRSVWFAICDLIEDTVANEEKYLFPMKWRHKNFTSDLVDKFGPLEDHMVDYAVDFLEDAAGSKHLAPAALDCRHYCVTAWRLRRMLLRCRCRQTNCGSSSSSMTTTTLVSKQQVDFT